MKFPDNINKRKIIISPKCHYNSNNGLRTGSRFPAPGLFRSGRELRYQPTDNIKPHFETHTNIRTPTPFPSPREERRKQANQFSRTPRHSRAFLFLERKGKNSRYRNALRNNGDEDGRKKNIRVVSRKRKKKRTEKEKSSIEKYDTRMTEQKNYYAWITMIFHDAIIFVFARKILSWEKNIRKNVTQKPIKGATSNQLFESFPYRAISLPSLPFF